MGNYDDYSLADIAAAIIPQREKMGNYDKMLVWLNTFPIIPQREKMGKHRSCSHVSFYVTFRRTTAMSDSIFWI